MALITSPNTETAPNFENRLAVELHDRQKMSHTYGYTVAYSANSLILRQKITEITYEYRGLDQAAAEKLLILNRDEVTTSTYYQAFGTNGDIAVVGIEVGTRKKYVAQRDGDSRMWTVRRTDETLAADSTGGWSTTRPSSSGRPMVMSTRSSSSVVFRYQSGSQVFALTSVEAVTQERYRFRTKTEAEALVRSNTVSGARYVLASKGGVYVPVLDGTNKTAQLQYVDGDSGYIVDVTSTTYTHTGW